MASPRSVAAAFAAAGVVLALGMGPSLAAFQDVTLSPTAGPVGTHVTMHAEMNHRWSGAVPSKLVMVAEAALAAEPSISHCEDVPGARVVADVTWESTEIEFQGLPYSGYVGDAAFTVPAVATGTYYLAESIDVTGTGCHVFASFEVTAGLPDTSINRRNPQPMTVAHLVGIALISIAGSGFARHKADRPIPASG